MKSIKAIVAGCVFIFVVLFLLGLLYIFIAVGYNTLAADYSYLKEIKGVFSYLIGIPVFLTTMFAGGYITASIANMHSNLKAGVHSFSVGLITISIMMYSALEYSNLTLTGIVVIVLALTASVAGGFYWLRGRKKAH